MLNWLRRLRKKNWLKAKMLQRLVVHTTGGESIDGSLVAVHKDGVILRAARLLSEDGKHTAMAGETWVPRERVHFVQYDDGAQLPAAA